MLVPQVIDRLKLQVPAFAARVEGAEDFADLLRENRLPQVTPAANVLPLGLQGRAGQASAGMFVQSYAETFAVLLTLRVAGQSSDRKEATLRELISDVLQALCGWAPDDEIGVIELLRGNLVSMNRGTLVYQIDFTITDQLRIPR